MPWRDKSQPGLATPRWVRERKRFDKEVHDRNEVHIMELDKYLYKTFREVIDLHYDVGYIDSQLQKGFYDLQERMDNK